MEEVNSEIILQDKQRGRVGAKQLNMPPEQSVFTGNGFSNYVKVVLTEAKVSSHSFIHSFTHPTFIEHPQNPWHSVECGSGRDESEQPPSPSTCSH